jgi:hypothetical protein
MSQFIDKAAISLTWLSPLRRVSDSGQGGVVPAGAQNARWMKGHAEDRHFGVQTPQLRTGKQLA